MAEILHSPKVEDIDGNNDNSNLNAEKPKEFKLTDLPEKIHVTPRIEKPQIKDPSKDFDLDDFESEMGWKKEEKGEEEVEEKGRKRVEWFKIEVASIVKEINSIDKILKKSAIKPGFEQLEAVPSYEVSRRRLKAQRKAEQDKTAGKNWFNMPAPEITPEIKHDLEVIQMRSVLDPKHFYKKNDMKALPKYFQIGKVVDSPLDYYSGRLTNKERKKTIVDELMADAEFSKYNKRKYKEIIDEKKKLHYKAHKHAKKLKKKKK